MTDGGHEKETIEVSEFTSKVWSVFYGIIIELPTTQKHENGDVVTNEKQFPYYFTAIDQAFPENNMTEAQKKRSWSPHMVKSGVATAQRGGVSGGSRAFSPYLVRTPKRFKVVTRATPDRTLKILGGTKDEPTPQQLRDKTKELLKVHEVRLYRIKQTEGALSEELKSVQAERECLEKAVEALKSASK